MKRLVIVVLLSLYFVVPSFADTFSADDLTVTIDGCCGSYGTFINKSNNVTGTITSIAWINESLSYANILSHGKYLVSFNWEGKCRGSYFAYASFPNASDPSISPQQMGDTLTLDFLMGAGCDGSYGPLKLTLKKDTGTS